MEDKRRLPIEKDYRTCADVWRRVSPGEDPYPDAHGNMGRDAQLPAASPLTALPGSDPCCMGSDAAGELEVLQGYIREEMSDAQGFRAFARCAPNAEVRRILRRIAYEEDCHAQQLQAVRFLIAGEPYRVTVYRDAPRIGDYRAALRAHYHEEVCEGFNYARSSEETLDFCLKKIFGELSREEYAHAETLRRLLAKTM